MDSFKTWTIGLLILAGLLITALFLPAEIMNLEYSGIPINR